jgi:hypothetical protein
MNRLIDGLDRREGYLAYWRVEMDRRLQICADAGWLAERSVGMSTEIIGV